MLYFISRSATKGGDNSTQKDFSKLFDFVSLLFSLNVNLKLLDSADCVKKMLVLPLLSTWLQFLSSQEYEHSHGDAAWLEANSQST